MCYHQLMDKRSEKTLKAVYNALSVLLREKDYRAIKVEEILTRSRVSRGAFYSHFKDKDDVLASLLDFMFEEVFSSRQGLRGVPSDSDTRNILNHIALHFYDEKEVILPILSSSGRGIFVDSFSKRISGLMNDSIINKELYKEGVPAKLQSLQLRDSFVSIISHWIEMGCIVSPETIVDYFYILHK